MPDEGEAAMRSVARVMFGPHNVTKQVFLRTPLSFGVVNIRPLQPGHVLVCPIRPTPRLNDLTPPETTDLWMTVQRVQRTLARVYKADGFNVAVQDGKAAGQSVAHVHCHIIPRRQGDMDSRGGGDKIYELLDGEEGDVGAGLRGQRWKTDAERQDRSAEEMEGEARLLARELDQDWNQS